MFDISPSSNPDNGSSAISIGECKVLQLPAYFIY